VWFKKGRNHTQSINNGFMERIWKILYQWTSRNEVKEISSRVSQLSGKRQDLARELPKMRFRINRVAWWTCWGYTCGKIYGNLM